MYELIERINEAADVKKFKVEELDQFVFDVSHQSYPHKILTGRKAGYIYDDHFFEDSGYTNPGESEHALLS